MVALLGEFNGNIDAANMKANSLTGAEMTATGFPFPLRTVIERNGFLAAGNGTYLMPDGGAAIGTPAGVRLAMFYFDPAQWAVSGRTLRLRVLGMTVGNAVLPGGGVTFGLYTGTITAGGSGSASTVVPNALVTGSGTATVGPAAVAAVASGVSADFAAPVAGAYALGISTTGALAAGNVLDAWAVLQAHWV
jgi:hypothetical protein